MADSRNYLVRADQQNRIGRHQPAAECTASSNNSFTCDTRQQTTIKTHVFRGTNFVPENVWSELLRRIGRDTSRAASSTQGFLRCAYHRLVHPVDATDMPWY